MTRPTGSRCLILFLALLPIAACERDREPEARPPEVQTPEAADTAGPQGPTAVLLCPGDPAGTQVDSQTIGSAGGRLSVGRHELQIPSGALSGNPRFRFARVGGDTVGITIEPHVNFGQRATLTIDANHCTNLDSARWQIWRMYPGQPRRVPTTFGGGRFSTPMDSTSGYIIAS